MIALKRGRPFQLMRLVFNYFCGLLLEVSKLYVLGRYLPKCDVNLPPLKMMSAVSAQGGQCLFLLIFFPTEHLQTAETQGCLLS